MRKHSKEYLENITPYQTYELLLEGNKRFIENRKTVHDSQALIHLTMTSQYPIGVILSCMDSRTSVEMIFDQGLGDLFSIRIAGNIVNTDILASIEYAVKHVGSKLLMVLGHTSCGAIKSAKEGVVDGNITGLLKRIQPAISKALLNQDDNYLFADQVAYANVENSLEEILTRSDTVKEMFEKGEIGIVGAVYDVKSGEVDFFKNLTQKKEVKQKQLATT